MDLGTVTMRSLLTLTKETGEKVFASVKGPAFESTARPILAGPAPSVTVSPMSLTPWPVTANWPAKSRLAPWMSGRNPITATVKLMLESM